MFVKCFFYSSAGLFLLVASLALAARPAPKLPPNVVGLGWRSVVAAWPFVVLRDGTLLGGETGKIGSGRPMVGVVAVDPWGQGEQTVFACDEDGTIWAVGGSGARAGYSGSVGNVFDLAGVPHEPVAAFGSDMHWMMAITSDGDMFAATASDVVPSGAVIVQAVGNLFQPTPAQQALLESLRTRRR